jgi:hypothetical protein
MIISTIFYSDIIIAAISYDVKTSYGHWVIGGDESFCSFVVVFVDAGGDVYGVGGAASWDKSLDVVDVAATRKEISD